MTPATSGTPGHERVRRWLTDLHRPERLDDAALAELLRAHGRGGTGPRAGHAAAELLREKIESLRAPEGAPAVSALPYRVLRTCFVDGIKGPRAAAALGLSERQLTRERSRAISLLAVQLAASPPASVPVPASLVVPRPALVSALAEALDDTGRVHVTGAPEAGNTTVVAAYAAGQARVFWHTFVPSLGTGLPSLLFEIGEHLAAGDPALASYLKAALPRPDVELAARIALAALRCAPPLVVLDDLDPAVAGPAVAAFLSELERVPAVKVVTIGGRSRGMRSLAVPPLDEREVRALLALHGAADDDAHVRRVHAWTTGNAGLAALAAQWLAGPSLATGEALRGAASEPRRIAPVLTTLTRGARAA